MESKIIRSFVVFFSLGCVVMCDANASEVQSTTKEFRDDTHHIRELVADFQSEQALILANDALQKYGQLPILHNLKAQAYKNMSKTQSAITEYTLAINESEKLQRSANMRGVLYRDRAEQYIRIKDYDSAITDLTKCNTLQPGLGLTLLERAECYQFKKNYKAMVADVTQALKVGIDVPMQFRAYNGRAEAYDKLGQPELAKADREKLRHLHDLYLN